MAPELSIIVPLSPVCGPAQALRCLEGIAGQPERPLHEIIIVDDASADLGELLDRLSGDVTVVRNDRRLGFAGSARRGAELARGEILVFLRDAAVPAAEWLAPLAAALADPGVGLAASATEGLAGQSPVAAWSLAVRAADFRAAEMPDIPEPLVAGALGVALAERGLRTLSVPASRVAAPVARTRGARRPAGEAPELTIVIPTLDAGAERVRSCIVAVKASTDVAHEIVIVDNGGAPQGFSAPVNAGVRAARGRYVVVMNDDVEPLAGWWPPLRAALDAGAAVTFPLTVGGPMRFDFAAWCFAMGRDTVEEFGHGPGEFFDPSLVIWYQDTDLLYRLRRAGRPPVLTEGSQIRHGLSQTVASEDPELSAWIRTQVANDREAFVRKHPHAVLNGHALAA
ncbi:MAG TPA: glycosyltransferase [Solirubrobacteraceae bacterium]|nr:glycosyltransferase [Solirubrobacteraceae bacterium]